MGIVVPEHFPRTSLKNDAERTVLDAFELQLTDGWWVLPGVGIADWRDYELDFVLVHPDYGVAVIEVKGHVPELKSGQFLAHGAPMHPQPFDQARSNAYLLRSRIREVLPHRPHLEVRYGVAFPNALAIKGALPPEFTRSQLLLAPDLDDAAGAVERLLIAHHTEAPGFDDAVAIVRMLAPDAEIIADPEARGRYARQRLDQVCAQHVRALERLDMNRRVLVTGKAGTGKTRLAAAWAQRARLRGERVLLTCFNDPLAAEITRRVGTFDNLMIGPFLRMALALEGIPELGGDEDDPDFWNVDVPNHLHEHWPHVRRRFDTIVVDEAQDFSPAWLELLDALLDPDGPRRVLMVADTSQELYPRGFVVPGTDEGWVRCELVYNCRNSVQIASLIRQRFDGASSPIGGPEAVGIQWLEASDAETLVDAAMAEYDRVVESEEFAAQRVLFATFSRATRDLLRDRAGFVDWTEGSEQAVVCETVHRVKGLEFDYVILVAGPDDTVTDPLLYVGCSRAVSGLTVVGPRLVAERLGLA